MSIVTFTHENFFEDDGVDDMTSFIREDVETLEDYAAFFLRCLEAVGFTYVESVGIQRNDKLEVWSSF